MAGGVIVACPGKQHVTLFVALAWIVAASGGLIFGYDIEIFGGVTSMESFLQKFFPPILGRLEKNTYCRYDNQGLQLVTYSIFLAGLVSALLSSWTTSHRGRRPSMLIAGVADFLIGSVVNAVAQNLKMLIIGRIVVGIGVAFVN